MAREKQEPKDSEPTGDDIATIKNAQAELQQFLRGSGTICRVADALEAAAAVARALCGSQARTK